MSSLSTSLKNSYAKWLCPYEDFLRIAKPGVHQQLEWENGGPLTPSPAPSPMKPSAFNTPSSLRGDSPAQHASSALQASVSTEQDTPIIEVPPPAPPPPPPQPVTSGFTAINTGGFTAVNSGFTSVNRPVAPAPIRAPTPAPAPEPKMNTPTKPQYGSPMPSAVNTPDYRPSSLGPTSGLKRQMSHDSVDSGRENGVDKDDDGSNSRRSKRLKKGQFFSRFIVWFDCIFASVSLRQHRHVDFWRVRVAAVLDSFGLLLAFGIVYPPESGTKSPNFVSLPRWQLEISPDGARN